MRKFICSVLLLAGFTSPAFSQIKIKKEDRIANTSFDQCGYCAWSCIETLARHHKIKALYDLKNKRTRESDFPQWSWHEKEWLIGVVGSITPLPTATTYTVAMSPGPYIWVLQPDGSKIVKHRAPGDWNDMKRKLEAAKVKYTIQDVDNTSKDLIKYAIWNKLGCMIVVKDWTGGSVSTHAMIIQNYTQTEVILFDPNDPDNDYTVPWDWINKWWTGYLLIIEPNKRN